MDNSSFFLSIFYNQIKTNTHINMKKIILILISLFIFSDVAISEEKLLFKYNIDKSLPEGWVIEFKEIMKNLQEFLPIDENLKEINNDQIMEIYTWSSAVKNPFGQKGKYGGASISGDGKSRWMILEINKDEFKYNSSHRYSVIVHEYYHIYQMSLSKNRMAPKWLNEGGAKLIEEIYVQQYYGKNALKNDLTSTNPTLYSKKIFTKPSLFEEFKTSEGFMDMNYAGSAFMMLVLVKELQKNNISEHEAFKLVLNDFWNAKAEQKNWKKAFEQTFKMSVKDFYDKLGKYSKKDVKKILPSKSLRIQDIFS